MKRTTFYRFVFVFAHASHQEKHIQTLILLQTLLALMSESVRSSAVPIFPKHFIAYFTCPVVFYVLFLKTNLRLTSVIGFIAIDCCVPARGIILSNLRH